MARASPDDTQPYHCRLWRFGQADAFKLDVRPSRVVEQTNTVTEQHGRDAHQNLVYFARFEALSRNLGSEYVDICITGSGLRSRKTFF